MRTIETFFRDAQPFVAAFDSFVTERNLARRVLPDHICYKCGSRSSFEEIRALFEREGAGCWSSLISGRTIAYIKLPHGGLVSEHGPIEYLELSDQKPDRSQRAGFDHIEAYPAGWPYDAMVEMLRQTDHVEEVVRPHHTTHDVDIKNGFLFRATREPLIEKIVREEIFGRPAH